MPIIQGTDLFSHNDFTVPGGGPYIEIIGTPTMDTTTVRPGDPASLLINPSGASEALGYNISGTPTIGWMGFFYRVNTGEEPAGESAVARFYSTGYTYNQLLQYEPATNSLKYYFTSAPASYEIPITLDAWHWIEGIYDVGGTTHNTYWRVDGVDALYPGDFPGVATTVGRPYIGSDSAITRTHRYSRFMWGSAASITDWLGQPPTSGRHYRRFYGPAQLGSSPDTLFTVPPKSRAVIRNIYANNPSGADAALTLGIQSEDQVTISIAASGDDGRVNTNPTGSYPPSGLAVTTTDGDLWNVKQFTGGNYRTSMSFFRFDTSVIPDDATITSAVLRMRVAGGAVDTDNRSMNFEWHPWTTLATSDFIEEAGTTAGSIDITALALLATGDVEDILSLTDPDANIDKTGYTGLRVGISGGAPTGINEVYLRAIDNATNHEAQLVLDYVAGNSIFDEDTVPAGDILFARRDTNYVLEAGEMLQGFADLVGSDLRNNIFEGGSDGTTITAGNSGGVSGDAFDSIVNGGAGTIIFDNEHSQGSLAMKIVTSAGSDTIYGLWDNLGTLTGDVYFRQYLYLTAYPAVIVRVGGCLTGGGAEVGQLNITDTGIVRAETDVTNNYAPGTVPVALNQWIRLEWRIRPAASATQQMEWRLYNNADSATITDTNSTSTATGNANIDQALWGVSETLAPSSYTFWVDNIAVSTDGWIGTAPSVVLVVDGVEYGL